MGVPDWDDGLRSKIFAVFDGADKASLGDLCRSLLSQQKSAWADCRRGYDSLRLIEERIIDCNEFSVTVQHNPGRTTSTEARVGEKDIAARPCFLCPDKIPDDQKMVRYRRDYMILCNPMPVFPEHFTIAFLGHVPQAINKSFDAFLQLMDDFDEGWTVLYNGPRCGASAPDHLHFQVVTGGRTPIEALVSSKDEWVPVEGSGCPAFRARSLGREALLIEAHNSGELRSAFTSYLEALALISPPTGTEAIEPMINLAGFRRHGVARLIIFPRRAHRPAAFYLQGDERIAVSPAIAEMVGVIVAPIRNHYLRLTADHVRGIYQEVTLDRVTADRAVEALTSCRSIR